MSGRAAVLQWLLLTLLTAAALALLPLHPAPWWPGPALRWQWGAALSCIALYGLLCGAIAWRARRPPAVPVAAAHTLVAWASQTGLASDLAARSVATLANAGVPAFALPLDKLDAERLQQASRILFIASTTGEGDPPDHAVGFLKRVMPAIEGLPGLRYGLLALGDRDYAQFCAFGRELDEWLARRGAHALFDRVEVDNADPGQLRHWQYLLAQLGNGRTDSDWERPRYGRWHLATRDLANPGCEAPAWRLSLRPADDAWPAWQAGDIAEIGPRHPPGEVEHWLARQALDGARVVHGRALRDWIAGSQWPASPPRGDLVDWVETLQPLPHREYSIASVPSERLLQLLVRCRRDEHGRLGLGSGWLCEHVPIGGEIDLRIRANPGFHGPAPATPMILLGNGTGVAGLRAHLQARIAMGARRNWLLLGERHADHDDHYADDLHRWQREGWLQRLDLAYSRGPGPRRYVQDALRAAAPALREWVEAGAAIYVCGSLQGMAPAVDAVIEEILGAELREELLADGRYRRDVY